MSRFNIISGEDVLGLASFGENTVVHSALDSPSGTVGTSLAMKSIGSSERKLKKYELVLLDIPCGFRGCHTDKSITFFFGKLKQHPKGAIIQAAHEQCAELEKKAAKLLVTGAVPEEIYEKLCGCVDPSSRNGFMNSRKFIGHSIGLTMITMSHSSAEFWRLMPQLYGVKLCENFRPVQNGCLLLLHSAFIIRYIVRGKK